VLMVVAGLWLVSLLFAGSARASGRQILTAQPRPAPAE
jgi:hypothetical protein